MAAGWVLQFILPGTRSLVLLILLLGAALLVAATIGGYRGLGQAATSRQGRFGVRSAIGISLFFGTVLLVNAIGATTSHRFDLTGLANFTLTSQTKEVLSHLDEDVEIVSFFSPNVPAELATFSDDLLEEYELAAGGHLQLRSIDPELNPDTARQYGVDEVGATFGTVIFTGSGGSRQVYGPEIAAQAEYSFTTAMLEVTGAKQKHVYFVTGHGENAIGSASRAARNGLRDNLFWVDEFDLSTSGQVPADASAVVIAGPRRPLPDDELAILSGYVEAGGHLVLLLDPNVDQSWRRFIARWGLELLDGTVIEPASHVAPNPANLLIPADRNDYGLSELNLPGATALFPAADRSETLTMTPLVWSSEESWLESDVTSPEAAGLDPAIELSGPLPLGVLIRRGLTRLAVVGDSDFASERNFHNGNNGDLLVIAVNWVTAGEQIVSVDRKVLPARRLLVTPEETRFMNVSSVVILPLLVLAAGLLAWRRRR